MYSLLLIVKRPDAMDHDNIYKYDNAIRTLEGIAKQGKGTVLLADNVIRIPLDKALNDVVDAISLTHPLHYTYAILTEDIIFHDLTR